MSYTEIPKIDATTGALPPKVLGHLDGRYGSTLYPVGVSAASKGMSASATASANSAALNAALAEAAVFGAKVFVPKGNYPMNAQIVLPDKTTLDLGSAVLDFAGSSSSSYFGVTGSIGADKSIPVTLKGAYTISVPAHGLVAGDWVKIMSLDIFDPASTNIACGELIQVYAVTADTVTFTTAVCDNYLTNPIMAKVTMRSDVRVEGGTIKGSYIESAGKIGARVQYADNFRWVNVRTEGIDMTHVSIRDSHNAWGENCNMLWARHSSMGYGFSFANTTRDSGMRGCTTRFIRHGFSTNNDGTRGGVVRRISCDKNVLHGSARAANASQSGGDAIDTHTAAEDIWITDNVVLGSTLQGINFECVSGRVTGNKVYGTLSNGISVHNKSSRPGRIKVCGNEVYGPQGHGISVREDTLAALGYEAIDVSGNTIHDATGDGIRIGFVKYHARVTSHGNTVLRAGGAGMSFTKIIYLAESGNIVQGTTKGIHYNDVAQGALGPDVVSSTDAALGFIGLECTNVTRVSLTVGAVSARDPQGIGVKIGSTCSHMSVSKYQHIDATTQLVNDGPSTVIVG